MKEYVGISIVIFLVLVVTMLQIRVNKKRIAKISNKKRIPFLKNLSVILVDELKHDNFVISINHNNRSLFQIIDRRLVKENFNEPIGFIICVNLDNIKDIEHSRFKNSHVINKFEKQVINGNVTYIADLKIDSEAVLQLTTTLISEVFKSPKTQLTIE